nr:DUF4249 domain-containing protein [Runella slithyformis]
MLECFFEKILSTGQFFTLCCILLITSCIDPVKKTYDFNSNLIKIDGILTDQDPFFVTVVQSRSTQGTEFSQPIRGANVQLFTSDRFGNTNNNIIIPLRESGLTQGRYEAPATFRARVGVSYRLIIRFTDGRTYESSLEKMVAAPPIQKVYADFNQGGLKDAVGNTVVSTVDVSVDFQDNAQEANFYQWRTFLYERQRICRSCIWNDMFQQCAPPAPEPPRTGSFETALPVVRDLPCDRPCWEVFFDAKLNIFSDALVNGSLNSKRPLRQVPFYVENAGALLQIEQISISPAVYRYLNLIRQQTEGTGTLTDVAPAPPVGNIRNVNNPEEPVLGYFAAVNTVKATIWIDRNQSGARRITMLPKGRSPSFVGVQEGCLAAPNRFIAPPEGWRF